MPNIEGEATYPNGDATSCVIHVGGRSRLELLDDLNASGVEMNEHGKWLMSSRLFDSPGVSRAITIVELTVRNLGFAHGACLPEIITRAIELGLALCPPQTGPYFRLQYLDQPEGFVGFPLTQHRAPPGSITIISEPLSTDDSIPKGFYLRCIQGVPWLRGYVSDALHVYDPDDHLAFRGD
jgi:hypothetical protein